jgi:hypothetical protein
MRVQTLFIGGIDSGSSMPKLKQRLTNRIYRHGLETGLPYGLLSGCAEMLDVLEQPRDYFRRRRAASALLAGSRRRDFMPRDSGYCRFAAGELEGFDRLTEIAQEIYHEREQSNPTLKPDGDLSPMALLLNAGDFDRWPEILEIALGRDLIEIVSDYLGAVPQLDNIDLWVSRPNVRPEGPYGSQLFHLDKPDRHYLSVFLNVFDVGEENGPFSFFPAPETSDICDQTAYVRHYYLGDGRLDDQAVFSASDKEKMARFVGPQGGGGMVDTSKCLHFGSRCEAGQRVLFVITFLPAHKPGSSGGEKLAQAATKWAGGGSDILSAARRMLVNRYNA